MEQILLNVRNEYQHLLESQLIKLQKSISSDVSVLLCNVRTNGNVGMVIRTACLMGCSSVIICGRKHYDSRFTTGAHHYIPVLHWSSPLSVTINTVSQKDHEYISSRDLHYILPKEQRYTEKVEYSAENFVKECGDDYTPVFLEQGGTDIREVNWKLVHHPLVILGNESLGIPKKFINQVKKIKPETLRVSIPQWSVMRSHNVAIAASIALWEIKKSKQI